MVVRKDILLNPCGDIDIDNGDMVLVDGADQIRQSWLIHIRTFLGELLTNINVGMPYTQKIFEKALTKRTIAKYFEDETLRVPGIIRVNSIEVTDFDINAREISVTVDCTAEGEERHLFSFSGNIPEGTCDIVSDDDFPLTVGDLRMWFDAQDLSNITYNASTPYLRLENKAGEGYAEGAGSGGGDYPTLVGVSTINNKRAVFFNNTPGNGNEEVLEIKDTMAIRGESTVTIFMVGRYLDHGGTYGKGPLAFTGQTVTQEECILLTTGEDEGGGVVWGAITRDEFDLGEGSSASSPYGNYLPFYNAYVIEDGQETLFYFNGDEPEEGDDPTTDRQLDGDGYIGCILDTDCVTKNQFGYLYFGELLVYAGELTSTQISDVNDWLAEKWGF